MRLLYIVTPSDYFLSHRLSLARAAAAAGWEIHVATSPDRAAEEIRSHGFTLHPTALARTIGTPARELSSLWSVVRLCRRLRPDLVHAISPKGAVFGGIAARLNRIPAVLMKGGLGTTMTERGLRNAVARAVIRNGIRASVSPRTLVVVQNDEERADLDGSGAVRGRTVVVQGSGIDCARFAPAPEPPPPAVVVLPARMLRNKGVPELVEAARLLRSRGVAARFVLAGGTDFGNRAAISAAQLRAWTAEDAVQWIGHCGDMPALLAGAHIVCLPSHGEGLPRSLGEAAAAGRPIVASDVAGCRDVVQHGVNGFLVPPRDPGALAGAIATLAADRALREAFGRAGRAIALAKFDERIIIPRMLALYRSLAAGEA